MRHVLLGRVYFAKSEITAVVDRLTAVGRKLGEIGVPGNFVNCYISARENLRWSETQGCVE